VTGVIAIHSTCTDNLPSQSSTIPKEWLKRAVERTNWKKDVSKNSNERAFSGRTLTIERQLNIESVMSKI
jgi:hypothetical protein